jgi:hypothetical protein
MSNYNLTVLVYFDPRSKYQDTLLFSPGSDFLIPEGQTASITWVAAASKYPAPKLMPEKTVESCQDEDDKSNVTITKVGNVGDPIAASVGSKEMKGKITITLHASNGTNESGNAFEVMGDSTIRNKGGNRIAVVDGVVLTTILNKIDPRVGVIASVGMAITLAAGAIVGWLAHG